MSPASTSIRPNLVVLIRMMLALRCLNKTWTAAATRSNFRSYL